jgi:hypothetical protein
MEQNNNIQQVINNLKRNFFNTAVADIYRAIDGGSLVGSFILTFCLMDYLTWIEYGEERKGFNSFIKERLVPLNFSYTDNDEELYSIRNGLVHSYGPSRAMIEQRFHGYLMVNGRPDSHLQRINSPVLRIDLYSMLCETTFAAYQVFEDAVLNCTPEKLDRMNRQITVLGVDPPLLYAQMHRVLGCFDETVVTLNDVMAGYTNYILYPLPDK